MPCRPAARWAGKMDANWRPANYPTVWHLLQHNLLLESPLQFEHTPPCALRHWAHAGRLNFLRPR
jgi:phosphoketolase